MLSDAEQFKKILFSLCRKVITQAGISADEIVAVSATSQREGMVWLDRFGKEIYAAPSVDLRGEEAADILSGKEPFIKRNNRLACFRNVRTRKTAVVQKI